MQRLWQAPSPLSRMLWTTSPGRSSIGEPQGCCRHACHFAGRLAGNWCMHCMGSRGTPPSKGCCMLSRCPAQWLPQQSTPALSWQFSSSLAQQEHSRSECPGACCITLGRKCVHRAVPGMAASACNPTQPLHHLFYAGCLLQKPCTEAWRELCGAEIHVVPCCVGASCRSLYNAAWKHLQQGPLQEGQLCSF